MDRKIYSGMTHVGWERENASGIGFTFELIEKSCWCGTPIKPDETICAMCKDDIEDTF